MHHPELLALETQKKEYFILNDMHTQESLA